MPQDDVIILITNDASDAYASPTASGAGPLPMLLGSSASTDSAGTTIDLSADNPDLSGVIPGRHLIRFPNRTTGSRYAGEYVAWSEITSVDNTTKTLTVKSPMVPSVTGEPWTIGGKVLVDTTLSPIADAVKAITGPWEFAFEATGQDYVADVALQTFATWDVDALDPTNDTGDPYQLHPWVLRSNGGRARIDVGNISDLAVFVDYTLESAGVLPSHRPLLVSGLDFIYYAATLTRVPGILQGRVGGFMVYDCAFYCADQREHHNSETIVFYHPVDGLYGGQRIIVKNCFAANYYQLVNAYVPSGINDCSLIVIVEGCYLETDRAVNCACALIFQGNICKPTKLGTGGAINASAPREGRDSPLIICRNVFYLDPDSGWALDIPSHKENAPQYYDYALWTVRENNIVVGYGAWKANAPNTSYTFDPMNYNVASAIHWAMPAVSNAYLVTSAPSNSPSYFADDREIGKIMLSEDPFVDAANGDFRLNDAPGGGALLKAAGWPNSWPWLPTTVGSLDVGAVQSGGSGTKKEVVQRRKRVYVY